MEGSFPVVRCPQDGDEKGEENPGEHLCPHPQTGALPEILSCPKRCCAESLPWCSCIFCPLLPCCAPNPKGDVNVSRNLCKHGLQSCPETCLTFSAFPADYGLCHWSEPHHHLSDLLMLLKFHEACLIQGIWPKHCCHISSKRLNKKDSLLEGVGVPVTADPVQTGDLSASVFASVLKTWTAESSSQQLVRVKSGVTLKNLS